MSPESRVAVLHDRAHMMKKVRDFFLVKNILEVDCPIASEHAAVDAHIDLINVVSTVFPKRYLHSSPEYGMKRLLSEGIGDIYQLSHVFRDGEKGNRHNPEFMMAEWYRIGISFEEMIEETLSFIRLFLGDLPSQIISYKDAFRTWCGFDPFTITVEELRAHLLQLLPHQEVKHVEKDDLLNHILALQVEPHLGTNILCVLAYYPPTQAALAETHVVDGDQVACRFEVYYRGVELANGYRELIEAEEQELRFHAANQERQHMGKERYPIDVRFIQALKQGLPPCCGVAVGFDRLMMLRHNRHSVKEVLSFDWDDA